MLNNPTTSAVSPQLPLRELGAAIEALIALYDAAEGDPDLELNGDEHDGTNGEDDFVNHPNHYGPGCPIADPDAAVDDSGCDPELGL
jgi:hypothetical protein